MVSDLPVYIQIANDLEQQILSGSLGPGEQLAPIRNLAASYHVNPNTIQHSLEKVKEQGLICKWRASRSYVVADSESIRKVREEKARKIIFDFFHSMKEVGYTQDQTLDLLDRKNGGTRQW